MSTKNPIRLQYAGIPTLRRGLYRRERDRRPSWWSEARSGSFCSGCRVTTPSCVGRRRGVERSGRV